VGREVVTQLVHAGVPVRALPRESSRGWNATTGHPAYVTSLVADITRSPARSFREWADDHADAFRGD